MNVLTYEQAMCYPNNHPLFIIFILDTRAYINLFLLNYMVSFDQVGGIAVFNEKISKDKAKSFLNKIKYIRADKVKFWHKVVTLN